MRKHAVHALELMQKRPLQPVLSPLGTTLPTTLRGLERLWKKFRRVCSGLCQSPEQVDRCPWAHCVQEPFFIGTCFYRFVWRCKDSIRRVSHGE